MESFLLLSASILLNSGRGALSKKISKIPFGNKIFFTLQTLLFFFGAVAIYLYCQGAVFAFSPLTVFYSFLYCVLLVTAQWGYTASLATGKVSVCSLVYAMGFIIPTLSGRMFFGEALSAAKIVGIALAILVLVLSARVDSGEKGKSTNLVPLFIAMVASGGLGFMQKVQQNSPYPQEKTAFMFFAFLFAALVSFVVMLFAKKAKKGEKIGAMSIYAGLIGAFFGVCNMMNTSLAGLLDSAVVYPVLNIGTIIGSCIFGIIFFRERLSKKDISVLIAGIASILVLVM